MNGVDVKRLILAVQKSGRLAQKTQSLLQESGIAFMNASTAKLRSPASNFPLDILYLRDDDIPECVASGVADIGIVGENVVWETGAAVQTVQKLGFSRCRLSVAVPRESEAQSIRDLQNGTIATSYPRLLQRFLEEHNVRATVRKIHGSTEIAPSAGIAEAICDLVSTGSTLSSNGLRELQKVIDSEAVLVRGNSLEEGKQAILEDLVFRMRSVIKAADFRYVLLNCPSTAVQQVVDILPGVKSPTVMPLALEGWSSVHTVIREADFWSRIEALRRVGAEGVLVLPIEKMVV